ncbi:MAG: 4Fe-4S dicluster domain-containing protein [bacterium]|nr:4Fe-4S dicluster domain-containing protein [bacterium]
MTDKINRRYFLKLSLLGTAGACLAGVSTITLLSQDPPTKPVKTIDDLRQFDWGFIVDTTRCIGCGACVRACKKENDVPESFFRTWVERYEIDHHHKVHVDSPQGAIKSFPKDGLPPGEIAGTFFVPKLCNQCASAPCTQVCPVGATFHTADGVVLIDQKHCIGCGYCVQSCPYGARYLDHDRGTADKCTLCYHRLHRGFNTACVEACPRGARLCGNMKDKNSIISRELRKRRYSILKAEMYTNPKCFYIGLDMEVK